MAVNETQPVATFAALSPVAHARLVELVQAVPQRGMHLYGVVDASIDEAIYGFIEQGLHADCEQPETICLYDGDPAIKYARYAPYLLRVPLEKGIYQSALIEQWLTKGWSAHWGIFLASPLQPDKLKQHFKKLIQVCTPQGKKAWMRFYDPRVLPKLLADMGPANTPSFFGKAVHVYLLPGMAPDEIRRITFDQNHVMDRLMSTGQATIETLRV